MQRIPFPPKRVLCVHLLESAREQTADRGLLFSQAFLTFSSLQSLLPACDTAITAALRTHRVVTLKSHLRPLPPSFLLKLLPPLLSSLSPTILVTPKLEERTYDKHKAKKSKTKAVVEEKVREVVDKADLEEMLATLDSIDCGEEVARRILEWFGTPNESALDGAWKINAAEVVREIGVDLLADGGVSNSIVQLLF